MTAGKQPRRLNHPIKSIELMVGRSIGTFRYADVFNHLLNVLRRRCGEFGNGYRNCKVDHRTYCTKGTGRSTQHPVLDIVQPLNQKM